MSELTPNLGLFKYNLDTDGKESFNITQCLNNNWDKIDSNTALKNHTRLEYALVNHTHPEYSPTSQSMVTLTSGEVNLQPNNVIYRYTVTGSTIFEFNTTNIILEESTAYTFELLLTMNSIYDLNFPDNVRWADDQEPDGSRIGIYFFAFRTIDRGTTWKGSLQGVWQ